MLLTELPEFVLEHIISFLSYDEIAKNRIVCQQFNRIGWFLLNRGFHAAEKYQNSSLKAVKARLPRRESERKKHPLAKKCDILSAIESRLNMLSMAFGRFIEAKLCCFIPGKVIDELFYVMRNLDNSLKSGQPHSPYFILQELRDVSTMAIEYFEDKIAPELRKKEMLALTSHRGFAFFTKQFNNISNELALSSNLESNSHSIRLKPVPVIKRQSIKKIVKQCFSQYRNDDTCWKAKKTKETAQRRKIAKLTKLVSQQGKLIKELSETSNEQSARLTNNEAIINDLKRQLHECKHNFPQEFSKLMDVSSKRNEFSIDSTAESNEKLSTDKEVEASIKKKRKTQSSN